jgi:hypothetical protein
VDADRHNISSKMQRGRLISANKWGFGFTSLIPNVVRNWSLLKERLKSCFAERETEPGRLEK